MLSLETRINKKLIATTRVVNQLKIDSNGTYLYEIEYCTTPPHHNEYKFNFQLLHNREEGVEKLLLEIYKKIDKIKKKI